MKTPKYCIVGIRPVKAEMNTEGGLGIYAFNWESGEFEYSYRYLEYLYGGYKGDVEIDELPKEEFDKYVTQLRKERGLC